MAFCGKRNRLHWPTHILVPQILDLFLGIFDLLIPKIGTSFPLSALVFEIQNICHIPLFTLLAHKKSGYFNVVYKLISFKHEGNILNIKRKVYYMKIYLFHTKSISL
jgi:hypothetical protein